MMKPPHDSYFVGLLEFRTELNTPPGHDDRKRGEVALVAPRTCSRIPQQKSAKSDIPFVWSPDKLLVID